MPKANPIGSPGVCVGTIKACVGSLGGGGGGSARVFRYQYVGNGKAKSSPTQMSLRSGGI